MSKLFVKEILTNHKLRLIWKLSFWNAGVQVWQIWMQGWAFGSWGGKTGIFSITWKTWYFMFYCYFFFTFTLNTILNGIIVRQICCCNFYPNYLQATRCSYSGKLTSDPDSTVYISGCPEKESMDISLMSKKVILGPFPYSTSLDVEIFFVWATSLVARKKKAWTFHSCQKRWRWDHLHPSWSLSSSFILISLPSS